MPFGNIGVGGFILIILVVLLLFGPKKLPELGRALGRTLSEFKESTKGLRSEEKEETGKPQDEKKS